MNFVRTFLSKRMLTKLVDNRGTSGDDRRMPRIRGVRRRGMTIPALRDFILNHRERLTRVPFLKNAFATLLLRIVSHSSVSTSLSEYPSMYDRNIRCLSSVTRCGWFNGFEIRCCKYCHKQ